MSVISGWPVVLFIQMWFQSCNCCCSVRAQHIQGSYASYADQVNLTPLVIGGWVDGIWLAVCNGGYCQRPSTYKFYDVRDNTRLILRNGKKYLDKWRHLTFVFNDLYYCTCHHGDRVVHSPTGRWRPHQKIPICSIFTLRLVVDCLWYYGGVNVRANGGLPIFGICISIICNI